MAFKEFMDLAYGNLTNGNYHTAFTLAMESRLGMFFYLILFGVPFFMVWFKTEDISLSVILLTWTVALYGHLMPGSFASWQMSALIVLGASVIAFRLLSPATTKD